VTQSQHDGGGGGKLLAGRAIKIRIGVASALALTIGAWLAPSAEQPLALAVPEERAAPLLEQQVQQRALPQPFVGVQDVAPKTRAYGVTVLAPTVPAASIRRDYADASASRGSIAGFAVFVSETHALTHAAVLHGRTAVQLSIANAATAAATVAAYDPTTALVLLQVDGVQRAPAPMSTERASAGALAVAVGQVDERDIVVPIFITGIDRDRYTVAATNDSVLPGMPIFTLTGDLLAIAAPDEDQVHAIPVREASERLLARASKGERPSSFGLALQTPTGLLAKAFDDHGAIVTDVIEGGPADLADIQAGDLLLTVGGVEIDSADTAVRALGSARVDGPTELRVVRTGRVTAIQVTPRLAYEVAALARVSIARAGPQARAIFTPELLASSGIPPSAQVLSVNRRSVTSRIQVRRELSRATGPVPVLLLYDDSRYFVAIESTR
jgi:S1-C subfamily serine protease